MKIIFDRKELCNLFPPLMCAVANRSTIQATEGILIEAGEDNTCTLTSYDTEKGIILHTDTVFCTPGKYVINAQKFFQISKVMSGDQIELDIDDKLTAKISCGNSSYKIAALPGGDFPTVPDISRDRSFIISQGLLKKMINKVSYAIGNDETRPIINGCFCHVEENRLTVVSCDTINLAKCSSSSQIENKNANGQPLDYRFVIPSKTINELVRLISDDDEDTMQVFVTRRYIVFIIGDITFFSRLIDGEYLDYNRVIVKDHKINVIVDRAEFTSALERASLVTEEKIAFTVRAHVKLNFVGDTLKVVAESTQGSTYDEIKIEHEGEDILIAFNNRYLLTGMRCCGGEKIKLSLSSALTGMNVEPVENNDEHNEFFMFLPLRMK